MDITALKVYDALYQLKLTKQEYEQIRKEQNQEEHTGVHVTIIKQRKDEKNKGKRGRISEKIGICVNHDIGGGEIILQDLNETKIKQGDRILYNTITNIKNIPPAMYAIHTATLQEQDTNDRDGMIRRNKKATTIEELKDAMSKALAYDIYEISEEQLKEALYPIFNKVCKDKKTRINVLTITDVLTRKNKRIAVMKEIEKYDRQKGGFIPRYEEIDKETYKIKCYTPKDEEYDYAAPGRELCGNVWLSDELQGKMPAPELEIINAYKENKYDHSFLLLTPDKHTQIKKDIEYAYQRRAKKEEETEIKHALKDNIQKQFKKGKAVRHGITYTKNSIEYEGMKITGKGIQEYVISHYILEKEEPNYEEIIKNYLAAKLKFKHHYYNYPPRCTLEGTENFTINRKRVTVKSDKYATRINGHNIPKEDVLQAITEAFYKNKKEYEKYLQYRSKISHKYQKILEQGSIQYTLETKQTYDNCLAYGEDKIILAMPVYRRDGKNYTKIRNKEFMIKNVNSLYRLQNKEYYARYGEDDLQMAIRQMHKAIKGLTPEDVVSLIEEGRKEHRKLEKKKKEEQKKRIKNSQEFIQHAEKLTKAQKVRGGWWVKGTSGQIYYVTKDAKVYTIKKGKPDKYLCIADMNTNTNDPAGRNDAVAKRLLMLSKDKKVADEVYFRGDKVDTHWKEMDEDYDEDYDENDEDDEMEEE